MAAACSNIILSNFIYISSGGHLSTLKALLESIPPQKSKSQFSSKVSEQDEGDHDPQEATDKKHPLDFPDEDGNTPLHLGDVYVFYIDMAPPPYPLYVVPILLPYSSTPAASSTLPPI